MAGSPRLLRAIPCTATNPFPARQFHERETLRAKGLAPDGFSDEIHDGNHRPMKYLRVLVVDDDADCLAQAEETLSSAKYSVTAVADFEKADAALARAKGKTVVVSELRVGGKCGLEFLSKSLKSYPQIPFVFLSSSPPLESVIGALKQGAYDFLRKPVDSGILRHSVARSIE